jgi:hypothetical protein
MGSPSPPRGEVTSWRGVITWRFTWVVLVAVTLVLFVVGIPASFHRMQVTCTGPLDCVSFQLLAEDANALRNLGLSLRFYAAYSTTVTLFALLAFYLTAAVLWWKSGTPMAVYLSFSLVAIGPAFFTNVTGPLVRIHPQWYLPVGVLEALGVWLGLVSFYLFPDARFVPRWSRLLAAAIGPFALLWSFRASLPRGFIPYTDRALIFMLVGLFAAGVGAQLYRYRRISGSTERQQTKWVVFGATAFAIDEIAFFALPMILPVVGQPGMGHLLHSLVGGTLNVLFLGLWLVLLGFSVLRYRLWDIDILIRGTLLYGVLTAALVGAYFSSVVLLQGLIRAVTHQPRSQLVTALATLAIAALFGPLRRKVQRLIDRSFYRRRYDSVRIIEGFGARLREEVDLDTLSLELVSVVRQALQPASVSLWLRKPQGRKRG